MKNNTPLNDLDRELWLDNINAEVKNSETKNIVLACSALKEKYRKRLIKEIDADIFWFCLKGDFDLIKERLEKRKNHFFNPEMLQSQFDIIEYPDYCTFIDIKYKPQVIVDLIKSKL
jgi:carbohydrate kinase (thermoresistant glucokinase family)